MPYELTVGGPAADLAGHDHLAIQAAIDYLAARGGGTVRLPPGTWRLGNAVRLRRGITLRGAGVDTVLRKEPSETVAIVEDVDWFEHRVVVADARPFRVGGGIQLRGRCPHYGQTQITISTVAAVDGQTLWLEQAGRGLGDPAHHGNFWVGYEPTASTLHSLLTANWATDLAIADLRLDGNREQSGELNGNYGGAIYLQDCQRVQLDRLHVGNMLSDGVSFQVVHDLSVQDCTFEGLDQGIHPGSGSQRPQIRRNQIRHCRRHGLSWCWGVQQGLAADNLIEDCTIGSSIGHRDTHNVIRGNTIRRCPGGGLVYRDDPPHQAAHDNLVEGNRFEDIGTLDQPGYGIDLAGPVERNVLRGNVVVCTQPGRMRAAIRIGPTAGEVTLTDNRGEGLPEVVRDERPA
ncbi:MAG: right-handed parallel beta-helix repeat-containing protein [Fimbriimonadaceae bacterium]|nr:right-handed parallel beta-helix repeat-containing protein [Fimbriimonadaceae bacterium]